MQPVLRALVTGFEPFGGDRVNASCEAMRLLPPRSGPLHISTALLPTSYARAAAALTREIGRVDPAIVLCVGEAGDRTALNIERIAVNVQDARLPDNDGAQPAGTPVVSGAPATYFSTLPVAAIHAALTAARLPAVISDSAGTFVCNHTFFSLMHWAAVSGAKLHGGFLHVPGWRLPARDGKGAAPMTLEEIARGICIVLEASARPVDARAAGKKPI